MDLRPQAQPPVYVALDVLTGDLDVNTPPERWPLNPAARLLLLSLGQAGLDVILWAPMALREAAVWRYLDCQDGKSLVQGVTFNADPGAPLVTYKSVCWSPSRGTRREGSFVDLLRELLGVDPAPQPLPDVVEKGRRGVDVTCRECTFYRAGEDPEHGICRRNSNYPSTTAGDWCEEFLRTTREPGR